MNDDRSLERAARSWLEEGPTQAPDRAVAAALARVQTTRQERDLVPWRLPNMNGFSRAIAGMALIVAIVAIGVLIVRPGPNVGGPGATPTPSPTPVVTAPAAASPAATPSDAACRLLTSEEVASSSGNPGLGALPGAAGAGAKTSCIYSSGGGDVMARTDLTRPGGAAAFAVAKAIAGVQTQTDLGVDAVFDPASGTMYVLKGDAMVSIRPAFIEDTVAKQLAQVARLARLVIPRL
jgi:hypothetical protein